MGAGVALVEFGTTEASTRPSSGRSRIFTSPYKFLIIDKYRFQYFSSRVSSALQYEGQGCVLALRVEKVAATQVESALTDPGEVSSAPGSNLQQREQMWPESWRDFSSHVRFSISGRVAWFGH